MPVGAVKVLEVVRQQWLINCLEIWSRNKEINQRDQKISKRISWQKLSRAISRIQWNWAWLLRVMKLRRPSRKIQLCKYLMMSLSWHRASMSWEGVRSNQWRATSSVSSSLIPSIKSKYMISLRNWHSLKIMIFKKNQQSRKLRLFLKVIWSSCMRPWGIGRLSIKRNGLRIRIQFCNKKKNKQWIIAHLCPILTKDPKVETSYLWTVVLMRKLLIDRDFEGWVQINRSQMILVSRLSKSCRLWKSKIWK